MGDSNSKGAMEEIKENHLLDKDQINVLNSLQKNEYYMKIDQFNEKVFENILNICSPADIFHKNHNGFVFKFQHQMNGQKVQLVAKIMLKTEITDSGINEEFSKFGNEFDIMKQVSNYCIPFVTYLHGFTLIKSKNNDNKMIYNPVLIMELADGTLEQYINVEYAQQQKIMPAQECVEILAQILSSLERMYDYRIYHSDIKLSNILYKKKDEKINIQITDFGVSTIEKQFQYQTEKKEVEIGTEGYLSPQIQICQLNRSYTEVQNVFKCDMYSVGCCLFNMLLLNDPIEILFKKLECMEFLSIQEKYEAKKISITKRDELQNVQNQGPKTKEWEEKFNKIYTIYTNRGEEKEISVLLPILKKMLTWDHNQRWDTNEANTFLRRAYPDILDSYKIQMKQDAESKLQLDLNNAFAHFQLAELAQFYFNDNKEALDNYNKAIQMKGHISLFYNQRGYLFKQQGDLNLAEQDFIKAIENDENNVDSYINLGALLMQDNRLQEAEKQFIKGQGVDKFCSNAYSFLGNLYKSYYEQYKISGDVQKQDQYLKESVDNLKQAIELKPVKYDNYILISQVLMETSDFDSAQQWLQKGIHWCPQASLLYQQSANIFYKNGDIKQSLQYCQKAYDIDNNNQGIAKMLAYLKKISEKKR